MKIDSQIFNISSYKSSRLFGDIFFESIMHIFSNVAIFCESNDTPAITNGPNTEPLPASSIPPKNNHYIKDLNYITISPSVI